MKQIILTFRAEPDGEDSLGREPAYRLKVLLKHSLRKYGFRCTDYRIVENPAVEPAKKPHQSNAERREGTRTACNTTEEIA